MSVPFSGIDTYHLLNTEICDQVDKLTQIALRICNADAAFVSLSDDDRMWFKSMAGVDQSGNLFSNTICQYLIKENLTHLYIPDLSLDETFKEYCGFEESGIKFYAGFPLIDLDNSIFGVFCVIGYKKQLLDEVQLDFLKTMADQAKFIMNSQKLHYELSQKATRLEKRRIVTDAAAFIGKLGGFYLNISSKEILWAPSNNVLFNLRMDYSMSFDEFESGTFGIENSVLTLFEKIRDLSNSLLALAEKFSFEYESEDRIIEVHCEQVDHELYVVFQDKSDQYKLNHELKLYRKLMEQVEEIVNLGGWSYDLNTKEIFWTKNTYAIYDLPAGQKMNLNQAKSYFTNESFDELQLDFSNLLNKGNSYQKEYLFTSAIGIVKWVKASGHPIYTAGEITQVVGCFQDITEEKRMKDQLQNSEMEAVGAANNFKALVNNSTFYICKVGIDGYRTFCNDFYTYELGEIQSETSKRGIDFFHSVKSEYLDYAKEAFSQVASGSEAKRRILIKETNRNQVEVTNSWDFIGLKNSQMEIIEILCLGYDISELEDNRAQIQMLADYTAFQNKKLLEYNSIVSHDIRSHVANAVGLIGLMDLINNQDEYQNYFQLLKQEIKKTESNIIALDKLTSVTSVFESGKEPVSLFHLIEHVFELLRKTKPHIQFFTINKIPVDLILFSIREYLENVFLNVFANSLKLVSPERELQIEIDAVQITNSILQIKIVDTGKGIDMTQYGEEVFKIHRPLKDTQHGNGIGLYLVKKQIEALGGRVHIQSEKGQGTTIVLEFLNYED